MADDDKGKPRRDGSGRGVRANMNRGGCDNPQPVGKGRTGSPPGRGRNRRVI